MTLEQRSKLDFIAGRLEGLSYGVSDDSICDALMKSAEEIIGILKKDRSSPCVAEKREPKTVTDVYRCCKTCKYESLQADDVPCYDCWYGNGSCIDINNWEAKTDATQRAD